MAQEVASELRAQEALRRSLTSHAFYISIQFGRITLAPTSTSDLEDAPQSDRTVLPMLVVGAPHAHP
jgi:hypothetical protein